MDKQLTIVILAVITFAYGCSGNNEAGDKPKETTVNKHYTLTVIGKQNVRQVLKLPAQLAAYQQVSIFPKVNGYVKTVFVDIGSHVRQGQLLMVLEAPELEEAVVQAKERYARTRSGYEISRDNYQRLLTASRTPGAISPMDLETARSKKEADSSLSNAEKASWQMQQTMKDYLQVTAPFAGVITQRNVHPGALVSAEAKDSKPMLELKQVAHLRLQVDIPENAAAGLKEKDSLSFFLSAYPGRKMTGRISRISMNIDQQYRSERVELDVSNNSEVLSPGMYADVLFTSKSSYDALSVPKSAVVTSTERKYVIAVRDGKTVKVDVTTGNESSSIIGIVGALSSGETIVANANDEIKEGITLK